ncbi:MAG TPA: amidohydrolase [Alphaproteobacteria bacterium]|nr:amidohydrolase [Alphaproteobacteria bacterium]
MSGLNTWLNGAKAILPDAVTLRRRIHQHPELGLHLPETTRAVKEALAGLDVAIDEGPQTTGLLVTLKGATQGRTILLRGDMDALPMPEDTDLPFKSQIEGRMHACGHDSHTAMLAGAVHLLHAHRDRLPGTVKFMFQPGEEGYFGAVKMIEDGLIDRHDPKPDGAFAIHITPNLPSGIMASRTGPLLAATDEVRIRIKGKGGHASQPFLCTDPIPVACELVMALQAFVTRRINAFDPIVLTIGKISGGTTYNVIPEAVDMLGTLRSVSAVSRKRAKEGIEEVARGIAQAHGAQAEVTITAGYDVTLNDGRMVALSAQVAREMFGPHGYAEMPSPIMGGEDWSYVLQRIPGSMAFLGVSEPGCDHNHAAPCHSNKMHLHEDAMAHGIAMYAAVAERFLEQGFGA